MKATTAAEPATSAARLWRCGGRQCSAGECEHEENELHRLASGPGPRYAPALVHDVLSTSGSPLPDSVRSDMEHRLGVDFADVRIHTDNRAARSAHAVLAEAFTVGRHVVFGAGRYAPDNQAGRRLLLHELTHAAQNSTHARTPSGPLRVSSPDEPSERHAAAVACSSSPARSGSPPASAETLHRLPSSQQVPAVPAIATAPQTCVPTRALTWADFSGTPPAGTAFHALTRFSFAALASGGRDWIVATFNGASSWVRPQAADPTNRTRNGCAPRVTSCEGFFDTLGPGQTGWRSLGQTTGCAASPQPDTSLQATSRAQCETVLGTECDRVAVLESARLLRHEQLHFALACAMAAKGNAALAATPAPNTQTILSAVRTKAASQTLSYDNQSRHGCNPVAQATWETAVTQGLPAVTVP